ncbi:RNA polymerase sigma factor [Yinghuangia soli]|uniref:RNA polymerase sigma factor n=1 Tax=Yinghuangia soli TaxID=2908204 RepID=A0AA41PXV0_9ACTN|nr:DUF6596 domain-containing protein [Yinghuangia soli]MCF2527888.1 RNA polymerase sigma factor [Yinghuangia soli]
MSGPAAPGRPSAQDVEAVFRSEYGRAVAVLVRASGDIDLAEDAVQEAFAAAAERWPAAGLPPSPAGWIVTTARNRMIDRQRRESIRAARQTEAVRLYGAGAPMPGMSAMPDGAGGPGDRGGQAGSQDDPVDPADATDPADLGDPDGPVPDERLRLIFTCCHPALAPTAQVALTLRLLGGLATPEIARAFLVGEAAMAQRIVRAKAKIRDAGIPYRVPTAGELPERLPPVLAVVHLVFNEGYLAASGDRLVRDELCTEAVRLGRLLAELMPDEPEVLGLLALMLLVQARRPARTAADGSLVRLPDQDRSQWDRGLVAEGRALVRRCLRIDRPGPFQIQAAISAVHADAVRAEDTDWRQIVQLYDLQMALAPGPVVALHRAVAVAERDGPQAGLDLVDALDMDGSHLFHAVRAELLGRLGRRSEAVRAYEAAEERAANTVEREHLRARRRALGDG